jgi:hypothetical protein
MSEISNESWRVSRVRDGGAELRWIPLIRVKPSEPWIGTTERGHWVVEGKEGVVRIEHAQLLPLLHCLETPIEELRAALFEAVRRFGIDEGRMQEFPYDDLVDFALRSRTDYWAGLALQWLERLPVTSACKDALRAVIDSQWATQKTRQHAQRILVRITK